MKEAEVLHSVISNCMFGQRGGVGQLGRGPDVGRRAGHLLRKKG